MINGENLLDVLLFLDDEMIIEAGKKRVNRKRLIILRSSVAAACVALLLITALIVKIPYDRTQQILAGKDWRFFRDDKGFELVLPEPTDGPENNDEQLATKTEEPSIVTETPGLATEKPVSQTASPNAENYGSDPVVPEWPITDDPGDAGVTTSKPTMEPDDSSNVIPTQVPNKWTSYVAQSELDYGSNNLESYEILAWFGDYLDLGSVGTAPPEMVTTPPPDESTAVPTAQPPMEVEPTEQPPYAEPPDYTDSPDQAKPGEPVKPGNVGTSNTNWFYTATVNSSAYKWKKYEISGADIEGYLCNAVLQGKNSGGSVETEMASAYKIKGVSDYAVLAVKPDDMDGYYMFYNTDVQATSFREYMNTYNFYEYMIWDTLGVYVDTAQPLVTVSGKSNEIRNILLSADGMEEDSATVYKWGNLTAVMSVGIDKFGYENMPVALYEEGYIMFRLFDQTKTYYIGREKIAEIKALVE